MQVSFKVEHSNIESIATSFVIENRAVTLDFIGGNNNILETKYWIHNHLSTQECDNRCVKTDLVEKINEGKTLDLKKYVSVYTNSLFAKLTRFVEKIVKSKSFSLCSENYFFSVYFDGQGCGWISGVLWPTIFDDYNVELHNSSYTSQVNDEVRDNFLNKLAVIVSSICSVEDLMKKYKMCREEAEKLVSLIKSNHINPAFPELPSLNNYFKEDPGTEATENKAIAHQVCIAMKSLLLELNDEDRNELLTEEWLLTVSSSGSNGIDILENAVLLKLQGEEFSLKKDERLQNLLMRYIQSPFIGVYHYCISTCKLEDSSSVMFRREKVSECFVSLYEPMMLRALENKIEISFVNGFLDWNKRQVTQAARISEPLGEIGEFKFKVCLKKPLYLC